MTFSLKIEIMTNQWHDRFFVSLLLAERWRRVTGSTLQLWSWRHAIFGDDINQVYYHSDIAAMNAGFAWFTV